MIEKGKISTLQMVLALYATIMSTAILIGPSENSFYAQKDMWFCPIIASLGGFITVYIAYKLHQYYPGKTLFQLVEDILGKILGKIVAFSYVLLSLYLGSYILREYDDFIMGTILQHTPSFVIIGGFTLLSSFAIKGGIESVGRISQLFVPLIIIALFFLIPMILKDLEPKNMLPVFGEGIKPSLIGAISTQALFSELLYASIFFPYISDQKKALKGALIAVLMVMVTLVIFNIIVLFLFGNLLDEFTYPIINIGRYIHLADFFEHLESVVISVWILGAFVKLTVFHYTLTLGFAQTFNLKDYRPFVYPMGILMILLFYWNFPTFQELIAHFRILAVSIFPFFFTFLPVLLLMIAYIKNKVGKQGVKMG